jgi:hypothetical protein
MHELHTYVRLCSRLPILTMATPTLSLGIAWTSNGIFPCYSCRRGIFRDTACDLKETKDTPKELTKVYKETKNLVILLYELKDLPLLRLSCIAEMF